MKRLSRLLTLATVLAALAGCNTIQGIGEDIESAGDAISNTASKTKREMAD